MVFDNGLIFQWGYTPDEYQVLQIITFFKPFPNKCFSLLCSPDIGSVYYRDISGSIRHDTTFIASPWGVPTQTTGYIVRSDSNDSSDDIQSISEGLTKQLNSGHHGRCFWLAIGY